MAVALVKLSIPAPKFEEAPMNVFSNPLLFSVPAKLPTAVFKNPVVLNNRADDPAAVLELPFVLSLKALVPMAMFEKPASLLPALLPIEKLKIHNYQLKN